MSNLQSIDGGVDMLLMNIGVAQVRNPSPTCYYFSFVTLELKILVHTIPSRQATD